MSIALVFFQKNVCGTGRYYAEDKQVHSIMADLLGTIKDRPRKSYKLIELQCLKKLGCEVMINEKGKLKTLVAS